MMGGSIQEDPRLRLALTKAPVVFLNASSDFQEWHAALRRLVTTVNMQDGLLYSLPYEEVVEFERSLRAKNAPMPPASVATQQQQPALVTPSSAKKDKKKKDKEAKTASIAASTPATIAEEYDESCVDPPIELLLRKPEEKESPVLRPRRIDSLMAQLQVTESENLFFASATIFYNCRRRQRRVPIKFFIAT